MADFLTTDPGAESTVRPSTPRNATVNSGDRKAAADIQMLGAQSLESVRAVAGNWQKGMATLVGLTTATLLFKGAETIRDYAVWVSVVLGLLVFISLVFGVVSLISFLRSIHGSGKLITDRQVQEAGGWLGLQLQMAQRAVADLSTARLTSIVSIAALALALGFSWYGPLAEPDPPAYASLTYTGPAGQETICGELKGADATAAVLKITGEPQPRVVPVGSLVGLVIVEKC